MSSDNHVNMEDSNVDKPTRMLEKSILDHFSNLNNQNEKVRVKSSVNLLKHLMENDSGENENELKYALGRIIRGLGSSTVSSRTGFYTAMVALLNLKDISIDDIFEHLNKELHKAGSNTKGENADICVGQILGCGAILRSNIWDIISNEEQEKVLQLLLKASKERTYLSLVAYFFIINKLADLKDEEIRKIFSVIKDEFSKPWAEQNIDTLFFLISVKNTCPNMVNKKFLTKTIGTSQIICPESIEELCSVLMTIPRLTALKHPVYEIVSKDLAMSEHLPLFLIELDKNLQRPNRNKQLIATKILSIILQNLEDNSSIATLLTKNLLQQTLNYFKTLTGKNKDPEFHQSMQKFFETLLETLKREGVKSKTKIAVLKKLLFYPGTFIFEKITRSKIVQHITFSLNSEGVKKLAVVYRGVVEGTEKIDSENAENENWLNNDRLYAAHMLIKLLNHTAVKNENEWKVEQLNFLMNLGLFKVENGLNIGCELAASLKSAFFGALDLNLSKLEDLQTILLQLVKNLDSKITLENLESVLRSPITANEYEIWQNTKAVITKIEKKKKKGGLKSVFLTLFLHMGLQLFNDSKLASESLNELFACYEKIRKRRKNSTNDDETLGNANTEEENDDNDPLWIEVVTDLFLNLLSHNYHLLRKLIKCVFPHLCQYMTSTTIHQILSVIDPKNEENPLSKYNEDSSDDEVDEEDEPSLDDNDSGSEEDSEAESIEEEGIDDESVNDRLRMALHKVLSNDGYQTDEESVDIDQISDTEGEKLNKALAEAFLQFKPNLGRRKKQSKDQELLMHFRVRVLDLIEIYLDSTPSMILTLEIMLPLLQAIEFSIRDDHQKPLHDRLKSCLKKLSTLKKFSDTTGVDEKVLSELLQSLLEKGTKNSMIIQDMGMQIADCCIFVIRCSDLLATSEGSSVKKRKRTKDAIAEIISGELGNYFHKRDCLTPYILFKNIVQLSWDGVLNLIPSLLEYVFSESIKPFKKKQAAELLKIFYTNQRYISKNIEKISDKLSDVHIQFSQNIVSLFVSLCENPNSRNIKENFICNLFQLLSAMTLSRLNIENISWSEIAENVKKYRSHVTFSRDAKVAFNKLCRQLGVSHQVTMQPKMVELPNLTDDKNRLSSVKETQKEKKRKKGKNKEQLKLKKEAKKLRLMSLSEGFGNLDFTTTRNISVDDIDENERAEREQIKKTKKRKHSEDGEEISMNGEAKESEKNLSKKAKRKKNNSRSDYIKEEDDENENKIDSQKHLNGENSKRSKLKKNK